MLFRSIGLGMIGVVVGHVIVAPSNPPANASCALDDVGELTLERRSVERTGGSGDEAAALALWELEARLDGRDAEANGLEAVLSIGPVNIGEHSFHLEKQ